VTFRHGSKETARSKRNILITRLCAEAYVAMLAYPADLDKLGRDSERRKRSHLADAGSECNCRVGQVARPGRSHHQSFLGRGAVPDTAPIPPARLVYHYLGTRTLAGGYGRVCDTFVDGWLFLSLITHHRVHAPIPGRCKGNPTRVGSQTHRLRYAVEWV